VEQPGARSRLAERCVPELAEWLHNQDQMPDPLVGNQTVTVHAIGFAFKASTNKLRLRKRKEFLQNVVNAGGGDYYEADNGKELLTHFNTIFEQAAKVDNATFVNPSAVPTNSQNSTDQIYYALFQPSGSDRWSGNLKRYRFDAKDVIKFGRPDKEAVIYDANGNEALDSDGAFKSDSRSFWSDAPDGLIVNQGGAAWQLPKPAERHLFVNLHEFGGLSELSSSNPNISKGLLGAANASERKELLNYIRGLTDDGSGERAKTLGDFLHSAPVPFNYGDSEEDQVIIIGSNEGFVHLFNRKSGKEEWAFMPGELLKNIKKIKANKPSTKDKPHPYGVDNTVTIWQEFSDDKKSIKHIYAYITLRRGGRDIYALDITERDHPKLLWQIKGGEGDFKRLGQTWSQPVKGKIKIDNTPTDVLIFAGGYDATEDNFNDAHDGYRNNEALGNAIYIVDAITGTTLWSASKNQGNLRLPDMMYSIPAPVTAVDIDNDGLSDQLFVGDTGGQVWRFFIEQGKSGNRLIKASGADGNQPFAQLGENNPKNARRFYHQTDVARDDDSTKLFINIGSGYRAHPLNTQAENRFYSLRADLTGSPLAPLTESNLHQATRNFDNFNEEQTIKAIDSKQGWYLPLTIGQGEKVLSTPLSANGDVYFATYVPTNSRIGCQITVGTNYVYRLSLSSAAPPPLPLLDQQPAGIASAVQVRQPMAVKSKTVGIVSGGAIERAKGKSWVNMGGNRFKLKSSPCKNKTGCKTYWMDIKKG